MPNEIPESHLPLLKEKIQAGLTREDAEAVVLAQIKHDAKLAAAEAPAEAPAEPEKKTKTAKA